MLRKIRVLIVDDSLIFREILSREISADHGIEVVGTAEDPYQARDKIIELQPDVMTLDVEMPKMNGIEFLKKLMPQYPIPVVVVSAVNNSVFEALNAGAVDFVAKPEAGNRVGLESFIQELIVKVKIASTAKVSHWKRIGASEILEGIQGTDIERRIIAIGASTGGTEAIQQVLRDLPSSMPGIVVVQHMPPVFTRMYAERLNSVCRLQVSEAKDGDQVLSGKVLIAPGEYHMRIRRSIGGYFVECFKGDKVNGHCPSVDILFDSVARQAGGNALGIILTGMGNDGAKGLLGMRTNGARTIGQDESSCVVYGMPKVAYELGAVERQLPLDAIAKHIHSMMK